MAVNTTIAATTHKEAPAIATLTERPIQALVPLPLAG
jgi:hypothetical protein